MSAILCPILLLTGLQNVTAYKGQTENSGLRCNKLGIRCKKNNGLILFVQGEIYKLELRNQDPYIANLSHPETGTYQVCSFLSYFSCGIFFEFSIINR